VSPAVILRTEENKDAAIRRIKAIKPDQEKPLAVWVGPYKKIRSLEQNGLYWRLVGVVSDATGHDRDTLHTYFKRAAFGVRCEQIGSVLVEVVPSSRAVSKGDFSELIEYVQAFIAEHNIEEQI
jgi:hypothetical protein